MNIYGATFYITNDLNFKTILRASDLEELDRIVMEKILEGKGLFEVDGKNNRHFRVNQNGFIFIEYELMLHGKSLDFERIKLLDKDSLRILVKHITNEQVFAVSFSDCDQEFQDKIFSAMSKEEADSLKHCIQELWKVTESEILESKQMIIEVASILEKDGSIVFPK